MALGELSKIPVGFFPEPPEDGALAHLEDSEENIDSKVEPKSCFSHGFECAMDIATIHREANTLISHFT